MPEDIIKDLFKKHDGNYASMFSEISKKLFQMEQKDFKTEEVKERYSTYKTAKRMLNDLIVYEYMKTSGYSLNSNGEWLKA